MIPFPLTRFPLPYAVTIREPARAPSEIYADVDALKRAHEIRWCARQGLSVEKLHARAKIAALAALGGR